MMDVPLQTPPPPATIVLDNSSMHNLACPIPKEFFAPNARNTPRTYLDLLPYLARHGYRILIPEIVAMEAGLPLPYGNTHGDSNRAIRRRFINEVVQGAIPNIEIVKETGPKKANRLCRLWHDMPVTSADERDKKVMYFDDQLRHQGLGDQAILKLTDHLLCSWKGHGLVTTMTEDIGLRALLEQKPVHQFDARQLLHESEQAGLLPILGFKPDITAETLYTQAYSKTNNVTEGRVSALDPKSTQNFMKKFSKRDTTLHSGLKALAEAQAQAMAEARSRPRATLVLGSDFLMTLGCPVSREFRDPNAAPQLDTYLDLLPYLARNGYRIVIPEIVSVEVAQVLADGKNTKNIFSHQRFASASYTRPFLKAAAHGEFPNIEIVGGTGPAAADTFCDTLREAITADYSHGGRGPSKLREKEYARIHAVREVTQNVDRKYFSIQSIANSVAALRANDPKMPVYVLSNTREISKNIDPDVYRCSLRHFMHYLVNSGVAHTAGLAQDAGADAMTIQLMSAKDHASGLHDAALEQFSHKPTSDFRRQLQQQPSRFQLSLQELKADLDAAPPPPAPKPVDAEAYAHRNAAAKRAAAFSGFTLLRK